MIKLNTMPHYLRPLYLIQRLTGQLSFKIENKTDIITSTWLNNISFILLSVLWAALLSFGSILNDVKFELPVLFRILTFLYMNNLLIGTLLMVMTCRFNRSKILHFWTKLMYFGNMYKEKHKLMYLPICLVFIQLIAKSAAIILITNSFNELHLGSLILLTFIDTYNSASTLSIILVTMILKNYFEQINSESTTTLTNFTWKRNILKLSKAHSKICKLKNIHMELFSLRALCTFCENFGTICIHLFNVISTFYESVYFKSKTLCVGSSVYLVCDAILSLATLIIPSHLCIRNVST